MRVFVYFPPLPRLTGGLAVLADMARTLAGAGFDVRAVVREPGLPPVELSGLEQTLLSGADCGPGDAWLHPEGWVAALGPALSARARTTIYCQNWAYFFDGLPDNATWRQLPVDFVAVSAPVARYMELALGRAVPVARPGIDLDRFAAPASKPAPSPLRIAYMPRKNKALARQVRDMCRHRRALGQVEWVPIEGLPPEGVARALAEAHVFLATGFPEGCPLPPLEAMACGCLVVGCAGFGGFDYMRQAGGIDGGFTPWFDLEPRAFGGNGFYAADNDAAWLSLALEQAARLWRGEARGLGEILAQARLTAREYGLARARAAWVELFTGLWAGGAEG